MHLMYLWFRKTRELIRGQTIPRIQIVTRVCMISFLIVALGCLSWPGSFEALVGGCLRVLLERARRGRSLTPLDLDYLQGFV